MRIRLVDYKGKYNIAIDEDMLDDMDWPVGEITKEDLIAEARERIEACQYYGIPAYIGKDKELIAIFSPETPREE